MATHFHPLRVKRVTPEAAGSAAITFDKALVTAEPITANLPPS